VRKQHSLLIEVDEQDTWIVRVAQLRNINIDAGSASKVFQWGEVSCVPALVVEELTELASREMELTARQDDLPDNS